MMYSTTPATLAATPKYHHSGLLLDAEFSVRPSIEKLALAGPVPPQCQWPQ